MSNEASSDSCSRKTGRYALRQTAGPVLTRTGSQEEHLVVAVGGYDLVHDHRRVFVVGVGADHQRSPPHRVHRVEHDRVVAYKVHHVVRELFGCVYVGCEGSSGTLGKQRVCNGFNIKCFHLDLTACDK